ncbi:MAG TPA: CbiX/SirB N-terminal domain-containing protein [Abditibacteriaceae bacterium]
MKNAILLFSHGSLLCGAGENLSNVARQMRERGDAEIVEAGYLNYSEPLFAEAFTRCVEQGATRVTVVPYFLVAGKFVKVDLPREVEKVQRNFPEIEVRLADAMRFHPSLADAIVGSASRAQPPSAWRDILKTAPQFCKSNPDCPLYDTPRCPRTGGAV